jgi:hypothetical protein
VRFRVASAGFELQFQHDDNRTSRDLAVIYRVMHLKADRILFGIMILAVGALVVWISVSHPIPEFNTKPVPQNAPTLNAADVEKLLGVDEFRVVRRVGQVPIVVKESFSNLSQLPFDLVEPGEEMSTDDLTFGKSSRRLVFLGLRKDSAILVYEQGGFANTCNAIIFWFEDGGLYWAATLNSIPRDMASLKTVVKKGQFRPTFR